MKEILYTKYNSTRKSEYQVSTSIVIEDNEKYVIKKAMQQKAEKHLLSICENARKIENLYSNIQIISNEKNDNVLKFPFIKGNALLKNIDFQNDSLNSIVEQLKEILTKIHTYNPEYVCDFKMTKNFSEFFTNCVPEDEKATTISNDSI